jgi:mRNA-degrading endonuclease RelE of RelBE toxin-antitoxin system
MKMWKVIVEKKVIKFLEKLKNKEINKRFNKIVNERLKKTPYPKDKKYILNIKGDSYLCELVIDKFRFYYEIKQEIIVINEIEYLGKVRVLEGHTNQKSGNKQNYPNQRRTIQRLKKWFRLE